MSLASSPPRFSVLSLSCKLLHDFAENLLGVLIHLHNSEGSTMSLKMINPSDELLGLSGDTFKDHALLICIFLFILVAEERMDHYC